MLGRNRFTEEGLARLVNYQRNRERTYSHREALRQAALLKNSKKVVCPFCGKEGQFTAMRRWHFENCKKAPNPSLKSIEQREKLRQRMIDLNVNEGNDNE